MANGFEDVEALGTNDALRRAGIDTELVSISDEPFVQSAHGITVGVDTMLHDLDCSHEGTTADDVMIFPGGMPGSVNLASNKELMELMKEHYAAGGTLAAICAAPGLVISQLDDVKGVEFTCFEGFESKMTEKGAIHKPEPAVRCGRIITGRSAGHALSFALTIIEALRGEEVARDVRHALYLD